VPHAEKAGIAGKISPPHRREDLGWREVLGVPVREELVSQKLGKKKISEPTPKTSPPWGAGGQNPVVVLLSF
jgi:hypothetical protein